MVAEPRWRPATPSTSLQMGPLSVGGLESPGIGMERGSKPFCRGWTRARSGCVQHSRKLNPNPRGMVWNVRALELTVAVLQGGGDPEGGPALAHELRWTAGHYDYATIRPWPIEVARRIG